MLRMAAGIIARRKAAGSVSEIESVGSGRMTEACGEEHPSIDYEIYVFRPLGLIALPMILNPRKRESAAKGR